MPAARPFASLICRRGKAGSCSVRIWPTALVNSTQRFESAVHSRFAWPSTYPPRQDAVATSDRSQSGPEGPCRKISPSVEMSELVGRVALGSRPTVDLRSCLAAAILSLGASAACANVLISVDKSTQQMTVYVDGAPRYHFVVSTGRAGYGTPSGTYQPQRLERTWFSKEYYNSPMPHSIFFHGGYAIHGSYEINRLGGPASHGCIRTPSPERRHALCGRETTRSRGYGDRRVRGNAGTATLEHDREKSQTFRIRSCDQTNAWSEIAIQCEAISC